MTKGMVKVALKNAAYCSQTPWLLNQTARENIIGTSMYDERRYATVVAACALMEDFKTLPKQDGSLIGTKGITLSGGQKNRIVCCSRIDLAAI